MSNKYSLLIKNAECYIDQNLILTDIAIKDNIISKISENIDDSADRILDQKAYLSFLVL